MTKRLPQFFVRGYAHKIAILVSVLQLDLLGILFLKEASNLVPEVGKGYVNFDGEATRFATMGHFHEHHRNVRYSS